MSSKSYPTILQVQDLHVNYGGIQAVKGVTFEVQSGQLVALIGSNGAGKTTTLNAVAGTLSFNIGSVLFEGAQIRGAGAWNIVSSGLAMVPEGRGVFTRMSILENLQMGAYLRDDKSGIEEDLQEVFTIFPRLKERIRQLAGTLSGGEQQYPLMEDKIFEVIADISKKGVSILLVEQNAQRALEIADTAYVMESGVISYSGTGSQLLHDPRIKSSYLGDE